MLKFTLVLLLSLQVTLAAAQTETPHDKGPDGLEGWKLLYPFENHGELPTDLVIARNGKVIRKVKGNPFVWDWMFVDNGRGIAYETGPLHFGMACVLLDLSTGHETGRYDCTAMPVADDAPQWVKTLQTPPDVDAETASHKKQ